MLLLNKDLGRVPKSGEGWDKYVLPTCGKLKSNFEEEVAQEIFKQAAIFHGDEHNESIITYNWEKAYTKHMKTVRKEYVFDSLKVKDLAYYDGDLWYKLNGIWNNSSEMWKDKDKRENVIGSWLKKGEGEVLNDSGKSIGGAKAHFNYYAMSVYRKPIDFMDVLKAGKFVFTNGYINDNNEFIETDDIPFTTTQIPRPYIKNTENRNWEIDKYVDMLTNDDIDKKKSLLALGGSLLSNINDGVFGIVHSSAGGIGKTQFFTAIKMISSKNIKRINTETTFGSKGNSKSFTFTNTENKTGLIGEELPTVLNKTSSDMIKDLVDPGKLMRSFENKGQNSGETINNLTIVVTSNRISNWYEIDEPLKQRICVVMLDKNEKGEYYPAQDFRKNIIENDDEINYLLSQCIKYYIEATDNKFRAEGFRFNQNGTDEYFKRVSRQDVCLDSFLNVEWNEQFETFEDFLQSKPDFITNADFKDLHSKWLKTLPQQIISLLHMKKRVQSYLITIGCIEVKLNKQKRYGKMMIKGIGITWKKQ